ncbi:10566_t:CDS:1, partial [Funneliformis caledonium]
IERRIKPANLVFETDVDLENIDDVFEKIDEGEILETNEKKIDFTTNQHQKLNLNDSLDTYGMLEKVKYHLYKAMKIYWHTEEGDALISAILDPRIKSLTFINNQDSKDQAKTLLQNKYNILKGENLSPILPEIRSTPSRSSLYQTSLFSIFEKQQT